MFSRTPKIKTLVILMSVALLASCSAIRKKRIYLIVDKNSKTKKCQSNGYGDRIISGDSGREILIEMSHENPGYFWVGPPLIPLLPIYLLRKSSKKSSFYINIYSDYGAEVSFKSPFKLSIDNGKTWMESKNGIIDVVENKDGRREKWRDVNRNQFVFKFLHNLDKYSGKDFLLELPSYQYKGKLYSSQIIKIKQEEYTHYTPMRINPYYEYEFKRPCNTLGTRVLN